MIAYISVLECSGQLKQKECLVKHYITGLKDVGGKCPSPSYAYGNVCCCGAACCWDKCKWDEPPHDCIEGVPNAKWVKDENNHFVVERNWKKVMGPSISQAQFSIFKNSFWLPV